MFFWPEINKRFVLRLTLVAITTALIFRFVALPYYIRGESMAPTYNSGDITIGWRPAYFFSQPEPGDIVIIRGESSGDTYLKRVLALAGEEVRFRNGALYVNDKKIEEPYVLKTGNWNYGPRTVNEGHVFAVGDNRSTSKSEHKFGMFEKNSLLGAPLW